MKPTFWGIFLLAIFILRTVKMQAQGPPIYTGTPILLGLDGGGIRTFGKYISKENATAHVQPIAIPYNFTAKLQVGTIVPFVRKSPDGLGANSGLGDVVAFAKYLLFQKDGSGKTFRVMARVKETFPTAKKDEMPALGSGAYQTDVGLVGGYVSTKIGLYGEVGYNFTSDNLPDNLIYNLAVGLPLLPQQYPPKQLNVFLEFTGNHVTSQKQNTLFIAPGIQAILGRRLLFESGIQLPLTQDVPDGQKTNFIFLLGTRVLIF